MEIIEAYHQSNNTKITLKTVLESYKRNNVIYIPKECNLTALVNNNDNNIRFIKVVWRVVSRNSIILSENCNKIMSNEKYIKKKSVQIDIDHLYHYKRIAHTVDFKKILYGISQTQSINITDKKDKFSNDEYYIDFKDVSINDLAGDPYPNIQKKLFIEYETKGIFETVVYIKDNKLRKDLVIGIDLNNYKLNMIAHIVPIKCQALELTMKYLQTIQHAFNGKKVLSIIEGPKSASAEECGSKSASAEECGTNIEDSRYLENWIKLSDFYCIKKTNNKNLGEAVSIRDLIKLIKNNNSNEYTFYFHSKGVSKKNMDDPFVSVWTELMFTYCISNIDTMIYHDKYTGGAIRSFIQFDRKSVIPYHFTGTFFWFSHKVFSIINVEEKLTDNYYCVEMLTGKLCTLEKSHCFLKDNSMSIYKCHKKHHNDMIKSNVDLFKDNLSKSIIKFLK